MRGEYHQGEGREGPTVKGEIMSDAQVEMWAGGPQQVEYDEHGELWYNTGALRCEKPNRRQDKLLQLWVCPALKGKQEWRVMKVSYGEGYNA